MSRRLSRRNVLVGAAAAGTAATAGAFALARRGSSGKRVDATAADATSPTPVTPTATTMPVPSPRGYARLVATAALNFDTFDALRSGETSVLEVLGRTHSRLLQWTNFETGELSGDLATSWEQPDKHTVILRLAPDARWHDLPPLNGRPVTAEDVVQHFRRAMELAGSVQLPAAQRAQDLTSVRRVYSPAPGAVTFETSVPDPFLLAAISGRFALIQAPEAVAAFEANWQGLDPASVVGTGPFVYEGEVEHGAQSFRAFEGGHQPPRLAGLSVQQPAGDLVSAFAAQRVDELLTRDRRDAADVRSLNGEIDEFVRFEEQGVLSTMSVGVPPWDNPELRKALSGALNRGELLRKLFGGRGVAAGPVPPVAPAFALPEADLAAFPGYRTDVATDTREARARWEAAGGPALGDVTVDFPSIFDPMYSASSVVVAMLNEALGPQFLPAVETYTTISARALEGYYGNRRAALWFGWGPPYASPDPSRFLLETYSAPETGYRRAALEEQLATLRTTFSPEERQALARGISRSLLDDGGAGILDWVTQTSEVFRWRYFRRAAPSLFPSQHLDVAAELLPGAPRDRISS